MEKLKVISSCCFLCLLPQSPHLLHSSSLLFLFRENRFLILFFFFLPSASSSLRVIIFHHYKTLVIFHCFPVMFAQILSPIVSVQRRARQRIRAAQVCIDASARAGVNEQPYLRPLLAFEQADAICFLFFPSLNKPPPFSREMSHRSRLMTSASGNAISCSL